MFMVLSVLWIDSACYTYLALVPLCLLAYHLALHALSHRMSWWVVLLAQRGPQYHCWLVTKILLSLVDRGKIRVDIWENNTSTVDVL